jgi:hypothetical protein
MMSKVLLAVSSVLMLVGLGAGCSPEVPANPTFTKDVQPIFLAHCVRCHGADDMLHSMSINGSNLTPAYCYLQRYEDEGACTGVTDCMFGAGSTVCKGMVVGYVTMPANGATRMPPPPAEPLNDWEKEVITRWVNNGAPQ